MTGVIKRGLLAGAAGTTLLNATTYLDMAVRGRGESDTPGRTIDALLKKAGRDLPGSSDQRAARRTALGALSGIASGLGIGVAASAVRASGVRLPQVLGAVATGAGAMVGTNLPMTVAGITDPRVWTAADWVSDAVPHLAYGVGTHAVIVAQDSGAPAPRPSAGLIVRSLSLGLASGMRASLGLSAPALSGPAPDSKGAKFSRGSKALGVAGELVGDKLPQTPSRLEPPGLAARFVSGGGGALTLARRQGMEPAYPLLAGVAGATVGAYGGAAWRRWASARVPDWQGALAEDAVALTLAFAACWRR